jgi:DNA-directed RNA polymerase specialized sigma subunit
MMFNKLSFEELAEFYGALATLENHYGKEATHKAIREMSKQLDQPRTGGILSRVTFDGNEIGKAISITADKIAKQAKERTPIQMSFDDPEEAPEPKKAKKVKRTRQRVRAEEIAKEHGQTVEEFIIDQFYNQKKLQKEIGRVLGVSQETISSWIRGVPQKTIKRLVGKTDE